MKKLMTGDEAIARGAYEAGVRHASAYPGTPSTEIMENVSTYEEIYAEWAPNEKVAMESAVGASMAGARSMASMKHVGVNVAADPLMTFAYMKVNGGSVLVTADEPGMFSSQNEQDNRNYAKMGKMPMFEPADSQECVDMMKEAYEVSEKYGAVVIMRMVTRVCHSKSLVEIGERKEVGVKDWKKDPQRYVCLPAHARVMRVALEERTKQLAEYSETTKFNYAEMGGTKVGVIASGPSYYYAKEVWGEDASYLKLGFTNPLPAEMIKDFCSKVDEVYIVEEDDPYIEEFVQRLGIKCHGKDTFPSYGEMTPNVLRKALYGEELPQVEYNKEKVIKRPPTFCAGCPHRGLFYRLGKRKDVMISGDIGCYTLATGAPYNAMDACICMGGSISMGHGAQQVFNRAGVKKKVITVLGDSTFFHTGVNSLINTVYNNSNTINIILDNRITGMTGHQQNPGTGFNVKGEAAPMINIEELVKAIGIKHVKVIDPNNLKEVDDAFDAFMELDEPSVIITRWPCVLKKFSDADLEEWPNLFKTKNVVDAEKCIGCKQCQKTGCPALIFDKEAKKVHISRVDCVGCDVCAQVCPVEAIVKED
ncbi:indolepyruvate ferredoxin oxidoreductase subunit alpha [Emergencia timonensis]|uniref:indolepyruvate ferredoxin oxidoreductase subunit alpha n=1 Tax=Emergencia timonensis TaxID=1776384 RepID=UPI000829B9FF|nr:indolepyruvate ferredoxin oxidoreductase subunit alpha [Emergencia timonensis]WNX87965.1 indolepyruvate ferredoxin oxidoreductase subunit alpha [Emergencia timonensis]